MSTRRKASSFSGADEQSALIAQWKNTNAAHAERVKALSTRITQQRQETTKSKAKQKWAAERDALNEEQDTAERQLLAALARCHGSVGSGDIESIAEVCTLKEELRLQLQPLRGLAQKLAARPPSPREVKGLEEAVSALRAQLEEARRATDDAEAAVRSSLSSKPSLTSGSVDFASLFASVHERARRLSERFSCSSDIQELFQKALLYEEQRVREAAENQAAPSSAVPMSVLSTAKLMTKMTGKIGQSQLNTTQRKELQQRVAIAFPRMTPQEVRLVVDEVVGLRHRQARCRTMALDYRAATDRILAAYEAALQASAESLALFQELEEERALRQRSQEALHAELALQREAHTRRLSAQLQEKEAERLAAKRAADARRAQYEAEFQQRLRELAEYEARKAEAAAMAKEVEEMLQAEADAEKAVAKERNKERVQYRQSEFEAKREARRQKEAESAMLRHQRDAALERFFEHVHRSLGVQRDEARVTQATVSSSQTVPFVSLAEHALTHPHGFSDEEVMSDVRARLFQALCEEGLQSTPYGREVASRDFYVSPAQRASDTNPFRGSYF